MKMDVRHELPAGIDVAWRELHTEAYIAAQREETGAEGEILSEETLPDGRQLRRTRVTLGRDLPSVAANLLGAPRLSYILEERTDDAKRQVEWKVIVDRISNKVKAEGSFGLVPLTETTCQRVVSGEIKVSVPLVGGRIEKGIGAELTKSYETTAEFARKWLAENA
ncbi:MAG: hypothetical protein ACI8S6_001580 [Myxococcota bacterium]|jgi:hypothetical protein